jgi:hypothetical protein
LNRPEVQRLVEIEQPVNQIGQKELPKGSPVYVKNDKYASIDKAHPDFVKQYFDIRVVDMMQNICHHHSIEGCRFQVSNITMCEGDMLAVS